MTLRGLTMHAFLASIFLISFVSASTKVMTAETLAGTRITDAMLYLSQVNTKALTDDCKNDLEPVELALSRSQESVAAGRKEDAVGELNVVEALLDSCLRSMSKLHSSEALKARANLRKVSRDTSNAEQLLQIWKIKANTAAVKAP